MEKLKEKLKAFGAWVWEWVTVLTGIITGGLSTFFEILDAIGAIDLTAFLTPNVALKITTAVAIVKGIYAFYKSRSA